MIIKNNDAICVYQIMVINILLICDVENLYHGFVPSKRITCIVKQ